MQINPADRVSGAVKFLLKDRRATDPTLISLVYRHKNNRFVRLLDRTIYRTSSMGPRESVHVYKSENARRSTTASKH